MKKKTTTTTTTKTYRDGDWTQKKSSIFGSRGAWLSLVGWLCGLVSDFDYFVISMLLPSCVVLIRISHFSCRRCMLFFAPPEFKITKENIKKMSNEELSEFPLV